MVRWELVKVWLAGEGSNELSGGVETLLRKVEPQGWAVAGTSIWREIRKYEALPESRGKAEHGDEKTILKLAYKAYAEGCEVLAFVRDVDADPDRARAIATGIARAADAWPVLAVIGGPAIPAIEGWVLAFLGVPATEAMSRDRANEMLRKLGLAGKHTGDYVDVIENADLDALPPGCDALRDWIATARAVLGATIGGAVP